MNRVLTLFVDVQKRTDEKHRRARRSHE